MRTDATVVSLLSLVLVAGACLAGEAGPPETDKPNDPPPSWEALTENARELAMSRYDPEAIAEQVAAKEERLEALSTQRAGLEAEIATILGSTETSLREIDAIDDPVLRDESLLRFRAAKDVRLKTVRAALGALNDTIQAEEQELATLRRILHGRRAEARLYGHREYTGATYIAYLSAEAGRVRSAEYELLRQLRAARLATLEQVILPETAPRVPDLTTAVLANAHER